ncbi:uncharacterized protein E2P81_ATG10693 [Venturia nashicola]|uniref:Uncharacterized protein n=1 Tax=Venturia nashicola TaxID=86259 RepID=A0A4Z1P9X5_9PEZI|nr:hypothetical protein E6O75_ATG10362 [Venturia nashicola]TLD27405.1 uncharacterized protein E2P81_ATG10693 [Venturia nashicola]
MRSSDNPSIHLNGTIEQVYAVLERDHPHILKRDVLSTTSSLKTHEIQQIHPIWRHDSLWRPGEDGGNLYNWGLAKSNFIGQGIDYLTATTLRPTVHAGPRKCSRVSCDKNSGIYWCYDFHKDIALHDAKPLAKAARYIVDKYQKDHVEYYNVPPARYALGQMSSTSDVEGDNGVNVVVRKSRC